MSARTPIRTTGCVGQGGNVSLMACCSDPCLPQMPTGRRLAALSSAAARSTGLQLPVLSLASALSTGPQLLLFSPSVDAPHRWHSCSICCQASDLLLLYIVFVLRLISFLCISLFLLILHFFHLVLVHYSPSFSIHCFYFNYQITKGAQYPVGFLFPFHL